MNNDILRAFLDDCKANPEDDTPRLILADWLEEHGDTAANRGRGHLLRWQCQVAADVDLAPRWHRPEEPAGMEHRAAWIAPYGDLAKNTTFERGLAQIRLHPNQCELLAGLGGSIAFAWVDQVTVSRPYGDQAVQNANWFATLLEATAGEHLTGLVIDRVDLSSEDIRRLADGANFARLQRLTLDSFRQTTADVATLLGSPNLGPLRLLKLSNAELAAPAFERIVREPRLVHLRHLDVCRNHLEDAALAGLAIAVFRPNLQHLSLWGNPLTDRGMEILADLDLPALDAIDLGFGHLTQSGVEPLVRARWLAGLRTLRLDREQLGTGLITLLAGPLDRLTRLSLSCRSVTGAILPALVGCPRLQNVRDLSLWDNDLTPDDIEAMTQSWNLPAVNSLDLAMNRCDDGLSLSLAQWPGLRQLQHLDLSYCDQTDDGLRTLVMSPHVDPQAELTLYGNMISPEFRAEVATLGRRIDVGE